jgi:hypothetical protein
MIAHTHSFMPEALASNATYVFHYKGNTSPPKVPPFFSSAPTQTFSWL